MVYVVVLVFMLVIVIEVVVSIARSERVIRSVRSIEDSAILSFERLSRELRRADSVVVASSVLGSHPGRLTLSSTDETGSPRTVEFYFSEEKIHMRENGMESGALSTGGARVTSLVFARFATSTIEGIRTQATFESGTSTHYRSEIFYSSTTLR